MARGRLLNKSVAASIKFHSLPDDTCRLMATWIISWLDKNGVWYADPAMVKSYVFPRRTDITADRVQGYLDEMENIGLIHRFENDGETWQVWPGFADNQPNLRWDRESTGFPLPPERFQLWLKEKPYPVYLRSKHWQLTRCKALERAGYRCKDCGSLFRLSVHHLTYVHLGNERMDELVVLCRKHHGERHGKGHGRDALDNVAKRANDAH